MGIGDLWFYIAVPVPVSAAAAGSLKGLATSLNAEASVPASEGLALCSGLSAGSAVGVATFCGTVTAC